ncbi:MAG: hypothetical protein HYY23_07445 [Verrucomicrobia bacterium]|nr:hypothetical protein [Verrucomicrobiota bacterium]
MSRYDPAQHSDSVRVPREVAGIPTGEDGFPQDLRLWVDENILVNLVLEAVQSVCEPGIDSRGKSEPLPEGRPRVFLTLLTYSYAVGIYASDEIEDRIATEPALRYLSAGARPSWHDLRRFRRQNREIIRGALTRVLRIAREFRLWSIAKMLDIDSAWCGRLAAVRTAEYKQTMLVIQAANDRINQAVLRDSMALDE